MGLILPDLLGPELVGRLVKIRRELVDDTDVGFCCTMGTITTLEFLLITLVTQQLQVQAPDCVS